MAYDVAQVCLNGHVVNASMNAQPDRAKRHCEKCGERTVTSCIACATTIPGEETISEAAALAGYHAADYTRPPFCSSCGRPFPWTERSLEAARELAREMEGLSDEEQNALAGTLDDLLSETPRTQLAATRFKRLLAKAGKGAAGALRDLMVDVMSEVAKKTILGP